MRRRRSAALCSLAVAALTVLAGCGGTRAPALDNGDPQDSGVAEDAGPTDLPDGGGGGDLADGGPSGTAQLFVRAKVAVGYSYYWGHGAWRTDDTEIGSCSGTCPSCTHTGAYGADCSGYVAKLWEVPQATAPEADTHPYSTYNFYYESEHWTHEARSAIQPGDALTYRAGSAGHIALYESGSDPYGAVWLYEARGCSTGIVHDLRTPDSSYIAIARAPRFD